MWCKERELLMNGSSFVLEYREKVKVLWQHSLWGLQLEIWTLSMGRTEKTAICVISNSINYWLSQNRVHGMDSVLYSRPEK